MDKNFYEWADTGKASEEHNSLKVQHDMLLTYYGPHVLNMGCTLAPIGSIKWVNDEFAVTNQNQGLSLHGKLFRDGEGRASKMTVEFHTLGSSKMEHFTYDYFYDTPLSLAYLPSRIVTRLEEDHSFMFPNTLKIYALDTRTSPLAESDFTIPTAIATNNLVAQIVVSNEFLVYNQQGRQFVIADAFSANQARKVTKLVYYIFAVLLFSPLVIYWWPRRRGQKTK